MAEDNITLPVTGMTCVNCAMNIERGVKKLPGVMSANVNFATEQVAVRFDADKIRVQDLIDKIFHMDLLAFQRYKVADLNTYLGIHSNAVGEMVNVLITPFPRFIGLILLLALSFYMDALIALASISMLVGIAVSLRFLFNKIAKVGVLHKELGKEVNFISLDTLQGYKSVCIFSRDDFFKRKIIDSFLKLNQVLRRKYILSGIVPGAMESLALIFASCILLITIFTYGSKPEIVVFIVTFFVIFVRMLSYANSLLQIKASIALTYPAALEIFGFLQRQEDSRIERGDVSITKFNNTIEFKNVSFSYNISDHFSCDQLNFTINKGQRIGIVGYSGSGKSTVVDLLLKFIEPSAGGDILIDGTPLRKIIIEQWRKLLGIVPQESFLLNGTISENIRFGNNRLSQEEIERAARSAMIFDFIQQLPEGFDTPVGDRGVRLSGGQRQRISIARALANHCAILILDEATSSLDSVSEKEVQSAIEGLPQELTVIMIAHRLSTLRGCDTIIGMDHGKVAEVGSPSSLCSRPGIFQRLAKEQGLRF